MLARLTVLFLAMSSFTTLSRTASSPIRHETVELRGWIIDDKVSAVSRVLQDKSVASITIKIDSPGGAVDPARKLVNEVKTAIQSGKSVECEVFSQASSGAFWLLQACSIRTSHVGSRFMTHEPMSLGCGAISIGMAGRLYADLLRDNDDMAETIAPRLGMTKLDYMVKIATGPWRMDSAEALAAHAIDRVVF